MNGKQWTKEEIDTLKQGVQYGWDWEVIARNLGRTTSACVTKYSRLQYIAEVTVGESVDDWTLYDDKGQTIPATKSKRNTRWTPSDINKLKELHRIKTSLKGMALQLQRTEQGIIARMYFENMMDTQSHSRMYQLGEHGKADGYNNNNKVWTKADVQYLRNAVKNGLPIDEIARKLGRTIKAIQIKASREMLPTTSEQIVAGYDSDVQLITPNQTYQTLIPLSPKPKSRPRKGLKEITASTIFDYVKKLELDNKALQQRIKEIQNILD